MGTRRRSSVVSVVSVVSVALVAVLAAVGLSGCWLQPGFGPERQSSNPFETSLTAGGSLHGMSVTAGTLFTSQAGGQLRAFTPTG